MHDALSAERAGVPAAAIMTDGFVATARAMARAGGLPDYPFAVVAHPISRDTDAELRAKAETAVRQCAAMLLERGAVGGGRESEG